MSILALWPDNPSSECKRRWGVMDTFQRMQKLSSCNIKNIDDSVYGSAGQVFSIRTLLRRDGWFETIRLACPLCTQPFCRLLVSVLTSCQQSPAMDSSLAGTQGLSRAPPVKTWQGVFLTYAILRMNFPLVSKEYSFFPLSTPKMFTFPTCVPVARYWESGEKASVQASTAKEAKESACWEGIRPESHRLQCHQMPVFKLDKVSWVRKPCWKDSNSFTKFKRFLNLNK